MYSIDFLEHFALQTCPQEQYFLITFHHRLSLCFKNTTIYCQLTNGIKWKPEVIFKTSLKAHDVYLQEQ